MAAGVSGLAPVLQLQAAVDGLGVALRSLPLIEADLAAGRLVCPIAGPEWRADDYQLVIREDRLRDPAIRAFRSWVLAAAREPLAGTETPIRPGISQGAKRGSARPSRGAMRPSK
jgi:LysR family glycine cleavage system transcriptional activator